MTMSDVVIVAGARTAIGRFGGGFAGTGATALGAAAIRAALERAAVEPGQVDHVVMGCAGQFGENAYISRTAAVGAGLFAKAPAITEIAVIVPKMTKMGVNRLVGMPIVW